MTALCLLGRIGGQIVAFDAASIAAVVEITSVARVPFAPPHVHGLSALRSQVVTVIDGPAAVGAGTCEPTGRAVLVVAGGHHYAIRIDAVIDVGPVPDAVPVDAALLSLAWATVATGRIALDGDYALVLDPIRLTCGSQVNAPVTIAA